ncbi:MAG: mevalonate kinase [Myxococcales bacterium]|nr:mevalonate kinase [Myxococcales bacterium]
MSTESDDKPPARARGRLFSRPVGLAVPLSPFGGAPTRVAPRPSAPPTAPAPTAAEPEPPALATASASPPESTLDPATPMAPVPELFSDFEEPTLLAPPFDEEPTLNEWGIATAEEVAELEAVAVEDLPEPELPQLVPVRRDHVTGRFGGANPTGAITATPAPEPEAAPVVATASPASDDGPIVVMASAPGKIILVGEHAVVYGHRAIAAAVDLCTTVTLRRRPGPTLVEDTLVDDPRLAEALATVVPSVGFGITIRSTLPVGCGMGSSAALAVAAVRAVARMEGREASPRECVERGFDMERVFHGTPSGLDHTVSASGGALLYRRGEPAEELVVGRTLRLVVANTGVRSNTADMLERVRQRNPVDQLTRIGALVEMTAARIATGKPIGEFLKDAHRMLRLMGVSTGRLDDLCRAMEAAGAQGAKLAGAGGGGIAIALVDEKTEDAVRRAAEPLAPGGVFTTTIAATQG